MAESKAFASAGKDIDKSAVHRHASDDAGRESLTQNQAAMGAAESFENAVRDAAKYEQDLRAALGTGDDTAIAIASYSAQSALVAAHRAIETAGAERSVTMRAQLAPVEARLNELFSRLAKESATCERLVSTAVAEINGTNRIPILESEPRFRVLLKVITEASNAHLLLAVANELKARPHEVYGHYLRALIASIRVEANAAIRDFALQQLERVGVAIEADQDVAMMGPTKRLVLAAWYGAPDLPGELFMQIATSALLYPITIGFAALARAGGLPNPVIQILMTVPMGLAILHDFDAYRDLALEARTRADLRAAGHYLAKVVAALGVLAIQKLVEKLRTPSEPPKVEPVDRTPPKDRNAPVKVQSGEREWNYKPSKTGPAKTPAPKPESAKSGDAPKSRAELEALGIEVNAKGSPVLRGLTEDGWGYVLTLGGTNTFKTTTLEIAIPNVGTKARTTTAERWQANLRALARRLGLVKPKQDAGHAIASMIAACDYLLNIFSESVSFNRGAKKKVELQVRDLIDKASEQGLTVHLRSSLTFAEAKGPAETVAQTYWLECAGETVKLEVPPIKAAVPRQKIAPSPVKASKK
ncbi:MAG: hypothetical protein QM831_24205 [Kofleriaceae bacterium]